MGRHWNKQGQAWEQGRGQGRQAGHCRGGGKGREGLDGGPHTHALHASHLIPPCTSLGSPSPNQNYGRDKEKRLEEASLLLGVGRMGGWFKFRTA